EPVHGKQSEIFHDGTGLFNEVSKPLIAARYHSLICDSQSTPECIEITSRTKNNIIMSLKHKNYPIFGFQFHPESIGTSEGNKVVKNFLVMK
ncbi:MAG: aminodeoxychorismate/anthranilate synthase component II, partial [Methanobacteriaceae archaeon]|nr:aminodeoxychorismate/anthranilate synthase component II [Methanobacteriaceae archaeon]